MLDEVLDRRLAARLAVQQPGLVVVMSVLTCHGSTCS